MNNLEYLDYFNVSNDSVNTVITNFTFQVPNLPSVNSNNNKKLYLSLASVSVKYGNTTTMNMVNISCPQIGRGDTIVSIPLTGGTDGSMNITNSLYQINNPISQQVLTFYLKDAGGDSTRNFSGALSFLFNVYREK